MSKLTKNVLRDMIRNIIIEQFTIPIHSRHSGFELYTEEEEKDVNEQGYVSPAASLRADGDDIRASMGGDPYGDVDLPDDTIYEKEEEAKK